METASSSTSFFGARSEEELQNVSSTPQSTSNQQKKKRSLPGTPNPDAEVIALSPKTLMATNRFICEVCHKGFQREQNLQLHRRGHNLPWKLKQKGNKEVKKKVYICPEVSCVHHDASRALGDLTGVKKHYFRKHGEKKYKCEKCSKKYAVQSDWKAHSKTCGTREYRCDCGTLFSRRDSFITHRAFCDALAQESIRQPPAALGSVGGHLFGSSIDNQMNLGFSQISPLHDRTSATNMLRLGSAKFDQVMHPATNQSPLFSQQMQYSNSSSPFFVAEANPGFDHDQQSQQQGLMQISSMSPNLFNPGFFTSDGNPDHMVNNGDNLHQESHMPSQMSATALLQKAAQMGSTTSNNNATTLLNCFGNSSTSGTAGGGRSPTDPQSLYSNFSGGGESQLQGLMNSIASGGTASMFGGFGNRNINKGGGLNHRNFSLNSDDRTTLDFLGVGYARREQQPQPQNTFDGSFNEEKDRSKLQ